MEPRLGRSGEPKIVQNHSVRSNGHLAWTRRVEPPKYDFVAPDFAQEIFEDVDGQLLAGTTPITKPKWCKPGVVTNREVFAIDDTEDGPETAIGDIGFPPVPHLEIGDVERALCKSDLPTFIFGYLDTRRDAKIPRRIEGTRIFPMNRVDAGSGVRRIDVAVPF